jgi:hypothetical protein
VGDLHCRRHGALVDVLVSARVGGKRLRDWTSWVALTLTHS